MRKLLLGAMGLIALGASAPAMAADMAVPAPSYKAAPAMIAAVYDWSGLYMGLNGGGGWTHKCWDNTNLLGVPTIPTAPEGCHDATGAAAGAQIGYRWQSGGWVLGLEAQGDWSNLKGSNVSLFVPGATNQSNIQGFGLFTGQAGYAWNSVLWYVKGGGAVVGDKFTGLITGTGVAFDQANQTRWGGTVGTGLEISFAPSWSVGVEYDHLFMGSSTARFLATGTGLLSRTDSIRQDVDLVTARINYRWGGPVVAKY
jgi:outer membrane immunogenic protein